MTGGARTGVENDEGGWRSGLRQDRQGTVSAGSLGGWGRVPCCSLIGDICVGDDLPHVAVLAVEVEAASLVLVVDLAIGP